MLVNTFHAKRTAWAAMRCQPLHKGHTRIINKMIEDFDTVIIGLGSANSPIDKHNPWNIETRIKMIRNVYGKRITIVPLSDIRSEQGRDDWVNYCLQKLQQLNLPDPTDYFTGSIADSIWYKNKFWDGMAGDPLLKNPLYSKYFIDVADRVTGEKESLLRRLHIMDRSQTAIPSATDIRTTLETREIDWKIWVPAVNHDLVYNNYPEHFMIKED